MKLNDGTEDTGIYVPDKSEIMEQTFSMGGGVKQKAGPDFSTVSDFENAIAKFFGAPYAISVDSCTHGLELAIRMKMQVDTFLLVPTRTYVSIPMLGKKLGLPVLWRDEDWKDKYCVYENIYDAAVLWKHNSYIGGTIMCISFQYQKHLSLGRGGMILCDDKDEAALLKKMSYDGRESGVPWRDQDISTMGYHYYMTPETAALGIEKLPQAILTAPRQWTVSDWPDVSKMKIFK